jgi:hypothetical protein
MDHGFQDGILAQEALILEAFASEKEKSSSDVVSDTVSKPGQGRSANRRVVTLRPLL